MGTLTGADEGAVLTNMESMPRNFSVSRAASIRLIPIVLIALLASVAVGGCKPAPPSADPTSKPETSGVLPRSDIGRLIFLGSTAAHAELEKVVSVAISPDGDHAYTSGYSPGRLTVFSRDSKTGELELVQSLSASKDLLGAVSLRLNRTGTHAVATAFRANTVSLFKRDKASGKLSLSDVAREGDGKITGLRFAIGADFSPDGHFVYAIADNSAALTSFRITAQDKLEFIETNFGEANCFQGARGLALSPDGRFIYVTSSNAGTLVVLSRDPQTGKTQIHQIIRNEAEDVHGLAGAFSVAVSPDGNFVYVSAGRFQGDNAITVFRKDSVGKLKLIQSIVNDSPDLKNFIGGNSLILSPDGLNVYAVASRSHALACFTRDRASGRLKYIETLVHDSNGVGPLKGVSGLGVSPDGNHIYAAAEENDAVSIFKRAH